MNTRLFLFTYLLFFTLFGCSQKYGIIKTHSYTKKMTAGNIPVDENNRPLTSGVQKIHLVYIETNIDEKPAWDTAWIEGKTYSTQLLKIAQDQIIIGKLKDGERDVIIQPEPGNILWQLMLTPVQQTQNSYALSTKDQNDILLRGIWKNKRVLYKVKGQTELATVFGE